MIDLECGHEPIPISPGFDVGYGTFNDLTYCYPCCSELERLSMMEHGAAFLYWTKPINYKMEDSDKGTLVDWPGTEIAKVTELAIRKHNMVGTVIYLWFDFDGHVWLGKHYPQSGEYVRCKRLKQKNK